MKGVLVLSLVTLLALVPAHAQTQLTCNGLSPTIVGTNGNDIIRGTNGTDVIMGLDGNDLIYAGAGDDVVCGGAGHDLIIGWTGNDWLYGGSGRDHVLGYDGNDTVFGGQDSDEVSGGRDTHDDECDQDYRLNDTGICAPVTNDNDKVYGDWFAWFIARPDNSDFGTVFNNTYDDYSCQNIPACKGSSTEIHVLWGLMPNEMDKIAGGDGNDRLFGSTQNDIMYGDDGNDWIFGGKGDDYMQGNRGDDRIHGQTGNDTAIAGQGIDFCSAEITSNCES